MLRIPIVARKFIDIGYSPENKILQIGFRNKIVKSYYNVPSEIHKGLLNSNDRDKYFEENIENKFQSRRIDSNSEE